MSIHDAEPGDIYTDANGKLWRIIAVCHQPTVTAEEVEGTLFDPNQPQQYVVPGGGVMGVVGNLGARATINKQRRDGGVSGLMWAGWSRIWRKPEQKAAAA